MKQSEIDKKIEEIARIERLISSCHASGPIDKMRSKLNDLKLDLCLKFIRSVAENSTFSKRAMTILTKLKKYDSIGS